jgi:glycerol-3-phosphate dehydrogenase subunit B
MLSAIAAADEGASVRLVSHKQSTLRMASGLIDVLGYQNGDAPLVNPFESMDTLPADHPYQLHGSDTVREALAHFDAIVDGYAGSATERNALVPTHVGTVKPTARYPASMAPGLASKDSSTLYLGFEEFPDFDGPHVAGRVRSASVPFDSRGVTISLPGAWEPAVDYTAFAHALDVNREVTIDGTSLGLRQALAERIVSTHRDAERIGLPAVLGQDDPGAVRAELTDAVGVPVFEVPMGPPSIPGLRLESSIHDALAESGVAMVTGNPVVSYSTSHDGSVAEVIIDRNGASIPVCGSQFILATGGLVGKGIDTDREGVREPIFDCHIPHPPDRYAWAEPAVFDTHEFARFGVTVDQTLRPQTKDGDPEFDNLRACGAVIGGYDNAAANAAAGVSITTGYEAGRLAAREVAG